MAKKRTPAAEQQSSLSAFTEFKRIFALLSQKQNYSDTFNDFLDFALYMMTIDKSPEQIETMKRLEARYTTKEEAHYMAELFLLFGHASENDNRPYDPDSAGADDYDAARGTANDINGFPSVVGFHDVLGDLFMDLVSHGHNGQFFTPQHVADMMALMIIGPPGDKDDPYSNTSDTPFTVCDPCCGSGRMLLAAAKIDRNMIFYGADVNAMCAKMTALNMVVNTMVGEVACMNTLSMEHYHSWHIRRQRIGTHWIPIIFYTGKNQTRMFSRENWSMKEGDKQEEVKRPFVPAPEPVRASVANLFTQIPQTDIRDAIMRQAGASVNVMEKQSLLQQLQKVDKEISTLVVPKEEPVSKAPVVKMEKAVKKKPASKDLKTGTLF